MLNIKHGRRTNKIRNPDLPPRIWTYMMLLLPHAIFQYIVLRRHNLTTAFRQILLADFVGISSVFNFAFSQVLLNRLTAVGIIETSCEFDIDLCVTVYLTITQKTIDQSPQPKQGPHCHRITDRRRTWRAELHATFRIGHHPTIGINHRWVVKSVNTGSIKTLVAEIVRYATLLGIIFIIRITPVAAQQVGNIIFNFTPALPVFINIVRKSRLEISQKYSLIITIASPQIW